MIFMKNIHDKPSYYWSNKPLKIDLDRCVKCPAYDLEIASVRKEEALFPLGMGLVESLLSRILLTLSFSCEPFISYSAAAIAAAGSHRMRK